MARRRPKSALSTPATDLADLSGLDRDTEDSPAGGASQGSRSVTLTSGGSLDFTLSVNLLDLSADDRAFLFGLIDTIDAYEKAQTATLDAEAAAAQAAGTPTAPAGPAGSTPETPAAD